MRFQVPQFIEIEDKIFGPLTFKQFVYLVGGAGLAYLFYELFPLYIAFFLILGIVAFAAALAFYKVNNKPFIEIVRAAVSYFLTKKIYIWMKREKPIERKGGEKKEASVETYIPKLSDSKLRELSWSLGVKDSIYSDTEDARRGRGINTGNIPLNEDQGGNGVQ